MVTTDDVTSIRRLIAENPGASRRRLSEKLCETWQWKQANGAWRDMVCRGLLLMLHRAGEIELPPIRFQTLNPFVLRAGPAPMRIDTTPIASALKELRLRPVMGAMAPRRLPAQIRLRSHTPRSIPATGVRNAAREKGTARKSRQRW